VSSSRLELFQQREPVKDCMASEDLAVPNPDAFGSSPPQSSVPRLQPDVEKSN
jgi:hypothetical protein